MKKREYLRAVRQARRIFVAVQPVKDRRYMQVRISRAKARALVQPFDDSTVIKAEWLDGMDGILMVA